MKTVQDRIANKIFFNENGCWEWTASTRNKFGYGQIKHNGKMRLAHRVSWEVFYGEIPEGLCVLHRCDNPKCVNPAHLFLGTHADNAADKVQKGRQKAGHMYGETNPRATLTADRVDLIRKLYKTKLYTQNQLASRFGVTRGCISKITLGKRWTMLDALYGEPKGLK